MKFYDFVDEMAYYMSPENCQLLVINTQVTFCIFTKRHGSLGTHYARGMFICSLSPWVSIAQDVGEMSVHSLAPRVSLDR